MCGAERKKADVRDKYWEIMRKKSVGPRAGRASPPERKNGEVQTDSGMHVHVRL